MDTSTIVLDPTRFTLNPIEVSISVLNHKIIATIVPKGSENTITNFQELCNDNSLTPLPYRFIVLLRSKQSHYVSPAIWLMYNFYSHARNFPCLLRYTLYVCIVYSINSHNRNFINQSSYNSFLPTAYPILSALV